jgi:hypothetical protein
VAWSAHETQKKKHVCSIFQDEQRNELEESCRSEEIGKSFKKPKKEKFWESAQNSKWEAF